MRCLLITDKFAPHRGGTAVVYTEWCRRLRDGVTVLTCAVPGTDWRGFDAAAPFHVVRVPFTNIPKVRYPLVWARLYLAARRLMAAAPADVLHAGQVLETGLAGAALKRRYGVPLVVHAYGEEIACYRRSRLAARCLQRVLHAADAITAVSAYTREQLLALGVPATKVSIQYPGVQPPAIEPGAADAIRRRYGLGNRPLLLTVSRLLERKGHDAVLRALPRIAERVVDVAYVVVGSGPCGAPLKALAAELGVADRVVFAGSLDAQEMAACYAAADVFIHPNRQLAGGDVEGFGIVFLEAGAAGKPVIGGNSGGTPEAVVDGVTGLLVDPNDVDAVGDAAIRILTDRNLARRLGKQGRERALAEFTWERAAEQIRAINEQVVREYRAAGAAG